MKRQNKVLITGFEPWGVKGMILRRNESKEIALKLQKKYGFETIILPVNDSCILKLKSKIQEYKPKFIISLGQSDRGFRIESMCTKDEKTLISSIAKEIKEPLGFYEDDIGEFYCNDIYFEALSNVPNTIFIHVPLFLSFKKVDNIIRYIIERKLNK